MNAPIQGTATGDIVKLAMIAVDKYLKQEVTRDKGQRAATSNVVAASDAGYILMAYSRNKMLWERIQEPGFFGA